MAASLSPTQGSTPSLMSRVLGSCTSAIGGIIFVVVGLGMLAVGGFSYFNTQRLMKTWESTTGVIVDFVYASDSDGGTITMPVVEYTTDRGQVVRARPYEERDTNVDVDGYEVGDEVEVFYNPKNPRDMFINDFMHVWFLPTLMGGMGTMFGLSGAGWCLAVVASALRPRRDSYVTPVNVSPGPTIQI